MGNHLSELGALKSRMEWSTTVPGRSWAVEGYSIYRVGGKYGRYEICPAMDPDEVIAYQCTLTLAFRWVADQLFAEKS